MMTLRTAAVAAAALLLAPLSSALAGTLQINSLGTTNAIAIEHDTITGDDRGGIAVGATLVIYNGDDSAGRFDKSNLGNGTALGARDDGITSDIGTGIIWSLGVNATTPVSYPGGTITHLLRHNGTTGLLDGTAIPLSVPITANYSSSVGGIFAGNGAIAVVNGANRSVWQIDTTTGQVTPLGTVAQAAWDNATGCENWARWGVLEDFGNARYLTYVQNSSTIIRYRLLDGNVSTVATFPTNNGLSDACSFSVSPATGRWYVHYEGSGVFRNGDETLAVADMSGTVGPATFVQTDIPTLSEWGLVMLSLLAATVALATLRRRSARS